MPGGLQASKAEMGGGVGRLSTFRDRSTGSLEELALRTQGQTPRALLKTTQVLPVHWMVSAPVSFYEVGL